MTFKRINFNVFVKSSKYMTAQKNAFLKKLHYFQKPTQEKIKRKKIQIEPSHIFNSNTTRFTKIILASSKVHIYLYFPTCFSFQIYRKDENENLVHFHEKCKMKTKLYSFFLVNLFFYSSLSLSLSHSSPSISLSISISLQAA